DPQRRPAALPGALPLDRHAQADSPPGRMGPVQRRSLRIPRQPRGLPPPPHAASPGRPLDHPARYDPVQGAARGLDAPLPARLARDAAGDAPPPERPGARPGRGEPVSLDGVLPDALQRTVAPDGAPGTLETEPGGTSAPADTIIFIACSGVISRY